MPELTDGQYVLSAGAVHAIIWSFTAIAIIVTSLRLGARTFIVKALGLDDFLIICALITCIALSALYHWHIDKTWDWYNVSYGSKQNSPVDEEIVAEKAEIGCRSYVVTDNTYVLVLPIAKCSILAFYRRISPSKKHRYMLYGFGFALIFQAILNVLLRTFALDPPSAWWDCSPYTEIKVRYDHTSLLMVNSSFQALADVIILALPLRIIYRIKLNRQRKAGLLIIYLLSFLSLGATLARLAILIKNAQIDGKNELLEIMARRIKYTYWAVIEVTTVIICANLPTMPVLVHNIEPVLRIIHSSPFSSHDRKQSGNTTSISSPVSSKKWYHGVIPSYVHRTLSLSKKSGYMDDTSKLRSDLTPTKEGHSAINIASDKGASIEMDSVV